MSAAAGDATRVIAAARAMSDHTAWIPSPAGAAPKPHRRVLPGFGLTLGFTLLYLGLIVLVPLAALGARAAGLSIEQFWTTVSAPRVVASFKLTFGAAL